MPTPHALRLGIGAGEMRWIGEDGVGQRRGEMLQRAGRGELHQRRSFPGPGDGARGATLAGGDVIAGIARLAVEEDMLARVHRFLIDEIVDLAAQRRGRARSEERRVGKEGVSTCRSRWSPYH